MKKKYIVITGGAGFVGTNLIDFFLKKTKYKIISIDNYSSGYRKNHIINRRVKYINSDTKNIAKIPSITIPNVSICDLNKLCSKLLNNIRTPANLYSSFSKPNFEFNS